VSKQFNRRNLIIILLVVVVIAGLGVFLSKDLPLRERYAATVNELEEVKNKIMSSAQAVEQSDANYKPDIRGNGLIDNIFGCGIDVKCPTAARTWIVALEPGKELDFAKAMIASGGYSVESGSSPCTLEKTSSCSITAKKDSYFMGINMQRTDAQPAAAVSPGVWRSVSVRVTDSK
ncbi:MAG TPA: hypothetical protein VJM32_04555, partial [Candidatus Saccharimonadales bacterium]|nr:hypothetical protein [Candidatus Saccharimonadales bacterium]